MDESFKAFNETALRRMIRLTGTVSAQLIPVIVGATASGKTELIARLSERLQVDPAAPGGNVPLVLEIISADAFQVYRGMDIGTAKPSRALRQVVPHHLIDIIEPSEAYSAGRFAEDAEAAIADVLARSRMPVVVGGSGLYIASLVEGLHQAPTANATLRERDPGGGSFLLTDRSAVDRRELIERLSRSDSGAAERLKDAPSQRLVRAIEMVEGAGRTLDEIRSGPRRPPAHGYRIFALTVPRAELYRRINARVDEMMAGGFIDEVRGLRAVGITPDMASQKAIGYREIHRFFDGDLTQEQAIELIKRNTRRYAKRQETWIRNRFPEAIPVRI